MDTVLGERGALAVPNVVVDRVPGHARVPIHHPSMEAMTALRWDQVLNRKIATPTTVQVRCNIEYFQSCGVNVSCNIQVFTLQQD